MTTFLVAIASFVGFIVAYNTYGRWLAKAIFNVDSNALVPAAAMRDDVDYVPTPKWIIFGHHFTSIAGTGPIVGPAIAVIWGWLPALLWVIFGSIFVGAVHDFAALIISMRNRGQTIGEIAGRVISPRARLLFLFILFFALTVVLAIFGFVIATIFTAYPESVLATWISLPIAVGLGYLTHKTKMNMLVPSLISVALIYVCVWLGAYYLPIDLVNWFGSPFGQQTSIILWTGILLFYCYFASVLPVWVMLQPRDFINSVQLMVALVLLIAGLFVAGITNQSDLSVVPAVATTVPAGTPTLFPFLFITVACGAVSGFHCLVSSGTSSKQIANEKDAQFVGYGSMLLEGALAVIVILACCAGIGMGKLEKSPVDKLWQVAVAEDGKPITGEAAFRAKYSGDYRSVQKVAVSAFVEGGANFLTTLRMPVGLSIAMIAVLVACFAATTLDTAARLQRYVIEELATSLHITPLKNRHVSTILAIALGGTLAILPSDPFPSDPTKVNWGTGGQILWPLFGATNQLLASLSFLVITLYLLRRRKPIWFLIVPLAFMSVVPGIAMLLDTFSANGYLAKKNYLLFSVSLGILVLQIWMMIEGIIMLRKARGVLEPQLAPLKMTEAKVQPHI